MGRYLVCYDIRDARRRRRIAQILRTYGDRVQHSVFELPVDRALMDAALAEIEVEIDTRADLLAVYGLCASCDGAKIYLGGPPGGPGIGDEHVFIV